MKPDNVNTDNTFHQKLICFLILKTCESYLRMYNAKNQGGESQNALSPVSISCLRKISLKQTSSEEILMQNGCKTGKSGKKMGILKMGWHFCIVLCIEGKDEQFACASLFTSPFAL